MKKVPKKTKNYMILVIKFCKPNMIYLIGQFVIILKMLHHIEQKYLDLGPISKPILFFFAKQTEIILPLTTFFIPTEKNVSLSSLFVGAVRPFLFLSRSFKRVKIDQEVSTGRMSEDRSIDYYCRCWHQGLGFSIQVQFVYFRFGFIKSGLCVVIFLNII